MPSLSSSCCCICKKTGPGGTYYPIPKDNNLQAAKWAEILKELNIDIGHNTRICNKHFDKVCFEDVYDNEKNSHKKVKKLKIGSYPSKNLKVKDDEDVPLFSDPILIKNINKPENNKSENVVKNNNVTNNLLTSDTDNNMIINEDLISFNLTTNNDACKMNNELVGVTEDYDTFLKKHCLNNENNSPPKLSPLSIKNNTTKIQKVSDKLNNIVCNPNNYTDNNIMSEATSSSPSIEKNITPTQQKLVVEENDNACLKEKLINDENLSSLKVSIPLTTISTIPEKKHIFTQTDLDIEKLLKLQAKYEKKKVKTKDKNMQTDAEPKLIKIEQSVQTNEKSESPTCSQTPEINTEVFYNNEKAYDSDVVSLVNVEHDSDSDMEFSEINVESLNKDVSTKKFDDLFVSSSPVENGILSSSKINDNIIDVVDLSMEDCNTTDKNFQNALTSLTKDLKRKRRKITSSNKSYSSFKILSTNSDLISSDEIVTNIDNCLSDTFYKKNEFLINVCKAKELVIRLEKIDLSKYVNKNQDEIQIKKHDKNNDEKNDEKNDENHNKSVGKLVWGYFKKCYYPAVTVHAKDAAEKDTANKVWVFWLGDNRVSELKETQIKPFSENLALLNVQKICNNKNISNRILLGFKKFLDGSLDFSQEEMTEPYTKWLYEKLLLNVDKLKNLTFYPYPEEMQDCLQSIKEMKNK